MPPNRYSRIGIEMQTHEAVHTPALDGLRAVAILWVIPHNAGFLEAPHYQQIWRHPEGWPLWAADHLAQMGWIGVQLFFVLSGFLITRILLRSRNSEHYFSNFYARRALRILPLYYLTLTIIFVVLPRFQAVPQELHASQHDQIWLWVFLSNWAQPFGHGVPGLTHFWSLAVEEQFYLVWPFVVLFLNDRRLIFTAVGLCVGALVLRLTMQAQGANPEMLYHFTVSRMDALLFGAIAALIAENPGLRSRAQRNVKRAIPVAAVLFLAGGLPTLLYDRTDAITQNIGYSLAGISFALVVLRLVLIDGGSRGLLDMVLSTRSARSVGKYSYAMYVVHFPLHKLLGERALHSLAGPEPFSPAVALTYAVSLTAIAYGVGMASYYLIEGPFLRQKHRFVISLPELRTGSHP